MTEIIESDLCPNCGINLDYILDEYDNYWPSNIIQIFYNKIIYLKTICENCDCAIEFIQFKYYYLITTRVLIFNKNKMFKLFNMIIDDHIIMNKYQFNHLNISNLPANIEYKQELEMFIKLKL